MKTKEIEKQIREHLLAIQKICKENNMDYLTLHIADTNYIMFNNRHWEKDEKHKLNYFEKLKEEVEDAQN